MNGVHDMGGDQGMGPIEYEKDERFFSSWEGRSMHQSSDGACASGISTRSSRAELLSPADYFRMSYYETCCKG